MTRSEKAKELLERCFWNRIEVEQITRLSAEAHCKKCPSDTLLSLIDEFEKRITEDERWFSEITDNLNTLPEQSRNVLIYRYIENKSCADTGDLMHFSERHVIRLINKALETFADMYGLEDD